MSKVRNMMTNGGRGAPNQFIIEDTYIDNGEGLIHGRMFQSYQSNIAFVPYDSNIIYLGEDWDYSRTTGRYRNKFLGLSLNELRARIKDGRAVILEEM